MGMEKTRRKPGLGAWGESRADGGGTREDTGVFLTGSLPGRRTPGDKRERPGAGRAGKGVPGRRNGLGLRAVQVRGFRCRGNSKNLRDGDRGSISYEIKEGGGRCDGSWNISFGMPVILFMRRLGAGSGFAGSQEKREKGPKARGREGFGKRVPGRTGRPGGAHWGAVGKFLELRRRGALNAGKGGDNH